MSYKVNYYKLYKSVDGNVGNISQGTGHIFTDAKIEEIPELLNKYLELNEKIGVITKIEDVGGECI